MAEAAGRTCTGAVRHAGARLAAAQTGEQDIAAPEPVGTAGLETSDQRYRSGGAGFVIDAGTMLADGFRIRRE